MQGHRKRDAHRYDKGQTPMQYVHCVAFQVINTINVLQFYDYKN